MSEPVVVRTLIQAPPSRVFRIFVEETSAWWLKRPTPWGSLGDPPELGKWEGAEVLEGGVVVGIVEVFDPGARLAFTLHGSRVAVDFEADQAGTRVTLTHARFEGWVRGSNQIFVDVLGTYWMDALRAVSVRGR